MARPGIEPRTSGLRVRCPTDCATRPGKSNGIYLNRPVLENEMVKEISTYILTHGDGEREHHFITNQKYAKLPQGFATINKVFLSGKIVVALKMAVSGFFFNETYLTAGAARRSPTIR